MPSMMSFAFRPFTIANESSSLKNDTRIARYVFANNLTLSASRVDMNSFGTSLMRDSRPSISTNAVAFSPSSPMMMREGWRLS
ncbi:hypothetical protein ATCV1_z572R [Acanthocystis turfacea chlorella virus 1]|uniref:Uncharacterized protein z572R n=1 Tax=Chlorovirus heliozoae TaxID=322019 RepID=A7K9I2_9PHYC|nr:hypothetical protein ATCV1_z572R [Acanthocystis turfacea chlorella virus 1]ABT16706.1 hypothetical protein ATCV1_z572R [Acanthocystis turfacea chlorella virus 1]